MEPNHSIKESDHVELKKNERLVLLLVFAVVLIVRFQFRQISLWDWDEVLFSSAIHKYNLWEHSPHPPGYFLWVALIRLAYKILGNEVNAQVFLSVLFGSLTVFPLYYIFRQAAPVSVALAGVLIFAFNPVVWTVGESGFSDTTAFFWFALALAVLLRAKENRYFYLGCFLLAVAMGVRTQNVLLGVFALIPLGWKLRDRDFKAAVIGVVIFSVTCLAWLIPTIIYGAGGLREYIEFMQASASYFKAHDDYLLRQPTRHKLVFTLVEVLISTWGSWILGMAINLLALIGLIVYWLRRKWWELLIIPGCFFPYFVFTTLFLELSYLKYTIPYIPFFCFFAAVGVYELASGLGRFRKPAFAAGIALILLSCTVRTLPVVKILHQEKSPIIQAIDYVQNNLSPEKDIIYYDAKLWSFARHYLKNFTTDALTQYRTEVEPQPGMQAYVLSSFYPERGSTWSLNFKQPAPSLRLLGKRHLAYYFNVWLSKTDIVYLDFIPNRERKFLWMREKGLCYLRNNDSSDKLLSLKAQVPVSYFQRAPRISIYLNDQLLEEFYQEREEMVKEFLIPGESLEANAWSKLEIKIDQTFDSARLNLAGKPDGSLGLVLKDLVWANAGAVR